MQTEMDLQACFKKDNVAIFTGMTDDREKNIHKMISYISTNNNNLLK